MIPTQRDTTMTAHPAGKRGHRPGVRLVTLPEGRALECLSCGALLTPGSPLAAAHVDMHRGPRWRRAVRNTQIRWRRNRVMATVAQWRRNRVMAAAIRSHRVPPPWVQLLRAALRRPR